MKLQNIDNKMLLQIAILGLLEDDKMTIHEVMALTKKIGINVWNGLRFEVLEDDLAQ